MKIDIRLEKNVIPMTGKSFDSFLKIYFFGEGHDSGHVSAHIHLPLARSLYIRIRCQNRGST